jgi:hypothetical protein
MAAGADAERGGYVAGILTGLVAAGALVHVWFAVLLGPLRASYAELADPDSVPGLTALVVHPAWLWGVPVVAIAIVIALIVKRPRRLGPYAASALLLTATLVTTWVLSQTSAHELADKIQSDQQLELVPVDTQPQPR